MVAPTVFPAKPEDAPAICEVFLRCFNDEYFQSLFPQNEYGRDYITTAYRDFMTSKARGSQEGQVFVTKDDQDKIAGACLIWIVKPEDSGVWSWRERWPPANAGQKDELLNEFFTGMHDQHETLMGKRAHIYFEIVIVDPSHQRKGHAKAMVKHAANIADALGYESYLDADEEVIPLYAGEGYIARTDLEHTSFMKPMVRPPRTSSQQ